MSLDMLRNFTNIFGSYGWVVELFVVVLLLQTAVFMLRRLLTRLRDLLIARGNPWANAIVDAAYQPAMVLLWIEGVLLGAEFVARHSPQAAEIFEYVTPVREVVFIFTIAWFLYRLAGNIQNQYTVERRSSGEEFDSVLVDAMGKLARSSVIIVATLMGMDALGVNITALLAGGAAGFLGLSMAAQDFVKNFFGGLTIYIDRPFAVGDWVRLVGKDVEGTVEHIGWRRTKIRTFDKRPLYVPNAVFTDTTIENPSRMSHRRIYETIGIRYADVGAMNAITADVHRMLAEHPEIDNSQTLMVNFTTFDASSLNFFVYCFTHTTVWTRFHEIKQDVLLQIADIIARHGAECAFPSRTLYMEGPLEFAGLSGPVKERARA